MHVIVKVSVDMAPILHGLSASTAESEKLLKMLEESGVAMKPVHLGAEDRNLLSYFWIETPDNATAEHVISLLQGRKEIEAAYLKPPDELPETANI